MHGKRLSNPRLCHTGKSCNTSYRLHGIKAKPVRQNENDNPPVSRLSTFTFVHMACADAPGTMALKHGFTCDLRGMHGSKSMLSQKLLHLIGLQSDNSMRPYEFIAFWLYLTRQSAQICPCYSLIAHETIIARCHPIIIAIRRCICHE